MKPNIWYITLIQSTIMCQYFSAIFVDKNYVFVSIFSLLSFSKNFRTGLVFPFSVSLSDSLSKKKKKKRKEKKKKELLLGVGIVSLNSCDKEYFEREHA